MTDRIELPDEHWMVLKDPKAVTYRERKPLVLPWERFQSTIRQAAVPAAMPASPKPGDEPDDSVVLAADIDQLRMLQEDGESITRDLAAVLIESWSFGKVPVTADALENLPGLVYDVVDRELWKMLPKLFLNTSPSKDEASPTPPSSASGRGSRARKSTSTRG